MFSCTYVKISGQGSGANGKLIHNIQLTVAIQWPACYNPIVNLIYFDG